MNGHHRLIQDLIASKMQLHAKHIMYCCVYCGIPHHIHTITIAL
jgi:hypothetical protein